MKRQRGQSVVEFAFVLPMFTLFLFGLIYGGIIFLQYFNLSNDARAEARRIAVMDSDGRNAYFNVSSSESYPKTEADSKRIINPKKFGSFYNVTQKIWLTTDEGKYEDVIVKVEFNRDNKDLPNILKAFDWPPKKFTMEYQMKIENEDE